MSESSIKNGIESLSKFFVCYYNKRKYIFSLIFFLRFQLKEIRQQLSRFLEDEEYFQEDLGCSLDLEGIKNTFYKNFKENDKRKDIFDYYLKDLEQIFGEFKNYEKLRRNIHQQKLIRKKCMGNYAIRTKNFNSFEMKNEQDINKVKESMLKSIEDEKNNKIKECNEKYKIIMDKLDSIKDKNEFYEFLKSLKLK